MAHPRRPMTPPTRVSTMPRPDPPAREARRHPQVRPRQVRVPAGQWPPVRPASRTVQNGFTGQTIPMIMTLRLTSSRGTAHARSMEPIRTRPFRMAGNPIFPAEEAAFWPWITTPVRKPQRRAKLASLMAHRGYPGQTTPHFMMTLVKRFCGMAFVATMARIRSPCCRMVGRLILQAMAPAICPFATRNAEVSTKIP